MNKKKYLIFQGWLYAISVLAILILSFLTTNKFKDIDEIGIIFGGIFTLFLIYKSYSCFKEIKNTRVEDRVYSPPSDATKPEIISYYKRILFIGVPAFFILSIWTYLDLKELESGAIESVRLWAPISLLYKIGGFWTAVLTTPVLGVLSIILLVKKIKEQNNVEE